MFEENEVFFQIIEIFLKFPFLYIDLYIQNLFLCYNYI